MTNTRTLRWAAAALLAAGACSYDAAELGVDASVLEGARAVATIDRADAFGAALDALAEDSPLHQAVLLARIEASLDEDAAVAAAAAFLHHSEEHPRLSNPAAFLRAFDALASAGLWRHAHAVCHICWREHPRDWRTYDVMSRRLAAAERAGRYREADRVYFVDGSFVARLQFGC